MAVHHLAVCSGCGAQNCYCDMMGWEIVSSAPVISHTFFSTREADWAAAVETIAYRNYFTFHQVCQLYMYDVQSREVDAKGTEQS